MAKSDIVLVTGGGGFLGEAITRKLLDESYQVRIFSRNSYPKLKALGAEQIQGDLRSEGDVAKAVQGVHSVIHTAAKAGIWGRPDEFFAVNYHGTNTILKKSCLAGVKRFVYTSSPSVCFGGDDILGANEDHPYARKHYCAYSHSKQMAEDLVLTYEGKIKRIALRPHLIWGPGDPHFLPRLVAQRKKNKIVRVGQQTNLVDVIHVQNAALAHLQALQAMELNPDLSRKAYFIGQERPVNLWEFVDKLLISVGQEPVPSRKLSGGFAYFLGASLELIYKATRRYDLDPPMTRFLALQLSKSHYFSHTRAFEDFSYRPLLSLEQGLATLNSIQVENFSSN